ncbi:MAG: bacillithiol biosynthesis cysteine-adding enzyme BshC [bacterium]|nr:bacillithiol biosynthesis cysteine-adding enzyme BshC [bacterium]
MTKLMMEETTTAPNKLVAAGSHLGYTRIYLDVLAGRGPAAGYFAAPDIEQAAAAVERRRYDREKLAGILRKQNSLYNSSAETFVNIDKLLDERTLCVFAGQQAGLYGGPLLTLIKALAVVKAADLYSRQLARPVIPIFWIAGDDHDFEEANHTFVLNRQGEPCRMAYETTPDKEWPTAETKFSDRDELNRVREQLGDYLGQTDFTDRLYELIDRAYTPADTFVSAFGRFMAGITDQTGLIFFSPGDSETKQHAAPFFRDLVDKQADMHDALVARNREIETAGYHIQVEKKDDSTHLFYNSEGRRPVVRQGDSFIVGEETLDADQIKDLIDRHPERFSPDVITRPVLQSYLFPVVSQKCGPAEIAYLAQLNPLFGLFNVPAPYHKARATLSIVESRFERQLDEYAIDFEELAGDIEQIINRVLARTFPAELEKDFGVLRRSIERQLKAFREEALVFDPQLEKFGQQIQGKIDFNLKAFEGKVFSSHKKKSQATRDRIYRLYHSLYTNRGFQERALNITYFLSRYGTGIVPYLLERLDSEETAHQLISLSEYPS